MRFALPVSLLAALLALLVVVGSASATKTHIFKEAFGPSAQPTFTTPRGMAIDQGAGDVYVIDAGSPPSVKRYSADGTVHSFSALSSNAIDGAGGADATPQGSLAFGAANRVQIAIDESGTATDGDIYVAQAASKLVDVFSSTGEYKGQLTESSEGAFGEICGVAVDSAGKLYVGDIAGKIHVYAPAANPPVKADNTANFATVASPCQIAAGAGPTAGYIFVNRSSGELEKVDAATGEVKYQVGGTSHRTVYVNPGTGHVYGPRATGSSSEVVEYDASGAASATTVSSFKPGSTIEGVAVSEASEDVYLTRSGQSEAQVFGPTVTQPDVTTTAATGNTGTHATLNGTVNPDGVELSDCFFEWGPRMLTGPQTYENTAPCAESNATIGAGTSPVAVHADLSGLRPEGTRYDYRLVAKNPESPALTGSQQSFTTPNTVITEAATAVTPTEATLNGTVNPDGETISECVFEWGPPKEAGASLQQYPETAPCVPGPGGITGVSPVAVHADLSSLHPGSEYVYRLQATYPAGPTVGSTVTVQSTGPAIEGAWAQNVIRTEATLKALVNPKGSATAYRFEWGTTTAYGHEAEGGAGSGGEGEEVGLFVDELSPGTTYHYRVTATSSVAENVGPDLTFTTSAPASLDTSCANQAERYGFSAALPDCRAYEMVSPVDKGGSDIKTGSNANVHGRLAQKIQASRNGDKLAYGSSVAFGDQPSALEANEYIASRGPAGWTSHGINAPQGRTTYGSLSSAVNELFNNHILAFSPDLSRAWVSDYNETPLAPGAVAGRNNFYERDNLTDTYRALGLAADFGTVSPVLLSGDQSHVVVGAANSSGGSVHLYDYSGGRLRAAGILPDGSVAPYSQAGSYPGEIEHHRAANVAGAVSRDGSRIFWSALLGGDADEAIYVRENPAAEQSALNGSGECTEPEKACTTLIAGGGTFTSALEFWAASTDGSTVLYSRGRPQASGTGGAESDLYLYDVDSETATRIAGESNGVVGQSEDLSRIYFVSEEALASGAVEGERNLYAYDEGAIGFIAALSGSDTFDVSEQPFRHPTRVSPDGQVAIFMSYRSLTGYDNTDRATGEPDIELYRYDARSQKLSCISCNPTGERPVGHAIVSMHEEKGIFGFGAAWIPSPEYSNYASNVLSEDGDRVFFNAFDSLVPGDTNGAQDVYQWEAVGSGACTTASTSFSPRDGGCLSLISTGQSKEDSGFMDASPDGRDVFFETKSSILPQDPGLIDIYDARVGGGYPPPPPPPPACLGDACQTPPTAPAAPSPASAGFHGAGNPAPRANCTARARRAQELSRRAKRLRRMAKRQEGSARRARRLRHRSARYAKQARRFSKSATRCRRANRRAGR